jgi:hypothetical protein
MGFSLAVLRSPGHRSQADEADFDVGAAKRAIVHASVHPCCCLVAA